MKTKKIIISMFLFPLILPINNHVNGRPSSREVQDFNYAWKFHKGDITNVQDPELADFILTILPDRSAA